MVIGGYDTARIDGELLDLPYNGDCPTCLTVESLVYETSNSTEDLIDEPMTFGLEAYGGVIGLPQAGYDRFQEFTGSTFNPDLGLLNIPDDAPRGNITARLSNGHITTIPAHELFTYWRTLDDDGRLNIMQENGTVVLLQNITTGSDAVSGILGWPFISQNYFVFDHERQELKIGKAKKGGGLAAVLDGTTIEPSIEAICPLNDGGSGGGGSNTGAIAGGVVGGIAGLALILFGVWFFLRRRKRARAAAAATGPNATPAAVEDQKPPTAQQAKGGNLVTPSEKADFKGGADMGSSPVEMSPETDPRYSMSELASPEQMNGTAGWEQEKDGGPQVPLRELEAPLGPIDEKKASDGQKGPVELP